MKKVLLAATLLWVSQTAQAQVGKSFPSMKAESLTHEFINLPTDLNGKYSLICLASSKQSEDELQAWFNPIYNNFILKPDENNFFALNYDLNTFFIPMFTGAKRPAYKKVMKKTEQSVNPKIKPYILFFEGSMKTYKDQLKMDNKKIPYFYILDQEGKIIHSTSGAYTDQKMKEVIKSVEPALVQ